MPKLVRPADLPAEVDEAVAVFGNRARMTILGYLAHHGPALRADIETATGIAAATLGNHLTELERVGVIAVDLPAERRRGRTLHYSLEPARVRHLLDATRSYVFPDEQPPAQS